MMHVTQTPGETTGSLNWDNSEFATSMARRIVTDQLPAIISQFVAKNRKYRKVKDHLGARGVFPDVNRKVGIIEARVWDGDGEPDEGEGEGTIEVIDDLIGHLLIMRDMLLQDNLKDKWAKEFKGKWDGTVDHAMVMSVIERQNDGHMHEWDALSNCIHCGKPGVGRLDSPSYHTGDLLPDVLSRPRPVKDSPQA
jgi:hypothetical protein